MDKRLIKLGAGIVGALLLLIVFASAYVQIPSGFVGVLTRFGKVIGERQPGVSWKAPFIESVTPMNVQVQKEQVDASAASKDLQTVTTTVALNYHLDHNQVSNVYVNLSADYVDRVISPDIQETTKAVIARYNAEELLSKRAEVADAMTKELIDKLQRRGIVVDQVSIVNFAFSSEFSQAIEQKQVAQQDAQRAQYTLQKAQLDAQANQAQQAALTPEILEQQAIAKWDGHLPSAVAGQGSIFNIPLNH